MSSPYCWWSLLRALSVEHLALLPCPSLLVPFLCAHLHQPDGVSISPSCAASHGGVCDLPLPYPHTKIICICSLPLLCVYKTPSFLNSLFILHEISLASPLSLPKPLSLLTKRCFHSAAIFPSIPNKYKHPFRAPLPTVLSTFVVFPSFPLLMRIKPRGASFLDLFLSLLSQFFFSVHSRNLMQGCVWCLPFPANVWAVKGP